MMKISLFYKSSAAKTCFALLLSLSIVGMPDQVYASFFSDLVTKVLGPETQAAETTPDPNAVVHNSQTIPLLESSVNPDMKNAKDTADIVIIEDEALASNAGPLGTDSIDKQYATSIEITTYTVKKGDSIDKVAKKYGVSKNTIIQSNDFLNSRGTLTVGQILTIIPVDGLAYTVKKGDTVTGLAKKYNATTKDILSYNDLAKTSDLKVGDTIMIPGGEKPAVIADKTPVKEIEKPVTEKKPEPAPVIAKAEVEIKTPVSEPTTSNAEVSSPVSSSGFIWPVLLSAGRISQGLHDDNAVDLAAPKGTPIYAPKDGTVLIADNSGYNGGYGLYVVVNFTEGGPKHFGHMSKVASTAGQSVKQGDIIGYVGTTGSSTGNHVHLSARGIKNPYGSLRVNNTSADFK